MGLVPNWFNTDILWLLLVLDLITTFVALRQKNLKEGDALSALVMKNLGKVGYAVIRIIGTWAFCTQTQMIVTSAGGFWPMWAFTLFAVTVIANNIRLIASEK